MNSATLSRKPAVKLAPALDRACLSARVAADHKGRDIVVLDMRSITPLYDFFVIITGSSRRQIHTLAEEIDEAHVASFPPGRFGAVGAGGADPAVAERIARALLEAANQFGLSWFMVRL
ncbi:MAG: RsfS/YbeB/iojap family protein, partial [Gemmataceae bacterium]